MKRLALFDLDNTLLAGDSDYEWGQFLVDRGVLERARLRGAESRLLRAVQGRHARHPRVPRLRAAPARRSHPAGARRAGTASSWRAHPADDPCRRRARWCGATCEGGDLCAIITATNSFVTAADRARIRHRAPDRHRARDARRPLHRRRRRARPASARASWCGWTSGWPGLGRRLDQFAESTCYSDSHNDLPLLERVRRPVAVDPDERLADEARRRGWETLSLR